MTALRSLAALGVVLVLVVGIAAGAEWLVRQQVEAAVERLVADELAAPGERPFASVETSLEGLALLGLIEGEFDGVRVEALDGTVAGVPVRAIEVVADGVSTDTRSVRALQATVRADAGALVAWSLDPALAAAVAATATPLPPDQVRVSTSYEVPDLGAVPVEVDVLFRAADGGAVVEPVVARAGGAELDLAGTTLLPSYGVAADQLPAGLQVRTVTVSDVEGRPVLSVDLSCPSGCSLR